MNNKKLCIDCIRRDALIDKLMNIVEGVRGERWEANGKRLVDTPEWCALYVGHFTSRLKRLKLKR